MFFKKVSLTENSWHYKLQKMILNDTFDVTIHRQNFCPYFWLTIFCISVFPVFIVFKLAYIVLKTFFKLFEAILVTIFDPIFDAVFCKPADWLVYNLSSDDSILDNYEGAGEEFRKEWEKMSEACRKNMTFKLWVKRNRTEYYDEKKEAAFNRWKTRFGEGWREQIALLKENAKKARALRLDLAAQALIAKRDREKAEEEAKEAARERNQAIQNVLMKIGKSISVVVIIGFIGVVGVLLYALGEWLYGKMLPYLNYDSLMVFGGYVLAFALLIVTLLALVHFLAFIKEKLEECEPMGAVGSAIFKPFTALGGMIKAVFVGIGKGCKGSFGCFKGFFGFFGDAFMMIKDKHCPQIEWEND